MRLAEKLIISLYIFIGLVIKIGNHTLKAVVIKNIQSIYPTIEYIKI